ncbi:hypothetical protein ONS95_010184 [Cadophora gregata]|uniref:uncharacterized protein n=1 Tax=Cadophora gregata TaxID=51156 RepID=UPI0026DD7A57|nr:uncharacterized protein ONS95_010184 [Cadophora gregata]KAK0121908.1 hypothetical protein ONS95_010184 [Cadophora gregata]
MDEASKLVGELQEKLSQLDLKVWKYRQDMAAEFEKYAEDLLRNVPKEISETVSKTMAEAMKGCTSLYPIDTTSVQSSATGTNILENGVRHGAFSQTQNLPIPTPLRRPLEDMEGSPRSPHEREKEFQGVFTPSYLPLLDSTSRSGRRSSYDHNITSPPPGFKGKEREDEPLQVDASTDTRSLMNTPEANRPPTPQRRNTDEWSISSDHSEGFRRRSALRRSSTPTNKEKGSPRRVRFEVEGMEVLPTSSPQPGSALSGDGPTSLLSDDDDDDEEGGSEMIEDVERPPPKRISSTQALRNLSRSPLVDDGTKWTTVVAPPDGSASVATTNGFSADSSSEDLYANNEVPQSSSRDSIDKNGALAGTSSENVISDNRVGNQDKVETLSDDDDDDEDMLDMPPLRRHSASQQAASMLSPSNPPNIDENKSPTSATRPTNTWHGLEDFGLENRFDVDDLQFTKADDDELFHFDENLESGTPRAIAQSPPEDHEDEERDSFDTDSPIRPLEMSSSNKYGYATSPARPIMRPTAVNTNSGPITGAVGSYKGHPFSMPVVSPDIHAQAASMGPLSSFVGSVNGRSGLDESNVQSFRASVGSFSGTPKSMSERMMMDDLMKAAKGKSDNSGRD